MTASRSTPVGLLLAACLVCASLANAASTAAQGASMFKDTTYQELQPYAAADRLIAVIRCEAIETVSPGSRRERQQMRGSLLAGPDSIKQGSEVLLGRHAQGAPLMSVGSSYLIAAHKESVNGPWILLEHREVKPDAAASEYTKAAEDASRRLGKPGPR